MLIHHCMHVHTSFTLGNSYQCILSLECLLAHSSSIPIHQWICSTFTGPALYIHSCLSLHSLLHTPLHVHNVHRRHHPCNVSPSCLLYQMLILRLVFRVRNAWSFPCSCAFCLYACWLIVCLSLGLISDLIFSVWLPYSNPIYKVFILYQSHIP